MKFKYKVWAEIEEEDVSGEVEPERVGEPEWVGCFDTNDEAIDFVSSLERAKQELNDEHDRLESVRLERDEAKRLLKQVEPLYENHIPYRGDGCLCDGACDCRENYEIIRDIRKQLNLGDFPTGKADA